MPKRFKKNQKIFKEPLKLPSSGRANQKEEQNEILEIIRHTVGEVVIILLIILSFGIFLGLRKKRTDKSLIHPLFEPLDHLMLAPEETKQVKKLKSRVSDAQSLGNSREEYTLSIKISLACKFEAESEVQSLVVFTICLVTSCCYVENKCLYSAGIYGLLLQCPCLNLC
jgi:hypothetical protein